jgi:hypothetical protein
MNAFLVVSDVTDPQWFKAIEALESGKVAALRHRKA